jgi:hypothetical protein
MRRRREAALAADNAVRLRLFGFGRPLAKALPGRTDCRSFVRATCRPVKWIVDTEAEQIIRIQAIPECGDALCPRGLILQKAHDGHQADVVSRQLKSLLHELKEQLLIGGNAICLPRVCIWIVAEHVFSLVNHEIG